MKFIASVIVLTIASFSNSPCFAADANSSALSVDRQSPTTDVVNVEDTQSAPSTTDPKPAEISNPTPHKSTCSSADN